MTTNVRNNLTPTELSTKTTNQPDQSAQPGMALNSVPHYWPSSPAINIPKGACTSPGACKKLKTAKGDKENLWNLCSHCKATYNIQTDHGAQPRPTCSRLEAYDDSDEWECHNPASGPGGMRAYGNDNLINEVINRWIESENWKRENRMRIQNQQSPTASPARSYTISNSSTQSLEGQDPAGLPSANNHKQPRDLYYWPSTPNLRLHRVPRLACGCPKYIPMSNLLEPEKSKKMLEEPTEEKEATEREATLPPMPPPMSMPRKQNQDKQQDDQRVKVIWTVKRERGTGGKYHNIRVDGDGNEYISRFGPPPVATVVLENTVIPSTRVSGRIKKVSPKAETRAETGKTLSRARAICSNCGTVATREWMNGPLPARNLCQSCEKPREPRSTKTESARLADSTMKVTIGRGSEPSTPPQMNKRKAAGSIEELSTKKLRAASFDSTKVSVPSTSPSGPKFNIKLSPKPGDDINEGSTPPQQHAASPKSRHFSIKFVKGDRRNITPTREFSRVASQTPSHPPATLLANPSSSPSTPALIKKNQAPAASTVRDHTHAERIEGHEGKPHPSGGCKPCREKGQTCRVYLDPMNTTRCNNCLKQKRTCKAT